MSSVSLLKERKYLEKGAVQQVLTNTPIAIRIRYIGTGSPTSVTVTTATNIVLIDSVGTVTSTFASDTTIAAVIGTINGSGRWEAKVLDALLSNSTTSSQFVTGAITSGTDGRNNMIWDVLYSTSTVKAFYVCLTPFKSFNAPKGHRVHLQEMVYFATLGGAGAGLFNVYSRRPGTNFYGAPSIESTVFTDTSVSATKTTYTFASGVGYLTGSEDGELIVELKDATSLSDAAANYLRITGLIE